MNDLFTGIAALVGTIGTIVATIAANLASGAKDEASDAKGKTAELKQTVVAIEAKRGLMEDNYRYVDYLLKNYLDQTKGGTPEAIDAGKNDGGNSDGKKPKPDSSIRKTLSPQEINRKALLASLQLIARANSSDDGNIPAEDRACLPIYLALAFGDSGSIAHMDKELTYVDKWLSYAESADDNDGAVIKKTAAKALLRIASIATHNRNIPQMSKGIESIDKVLFAIPLDKNQSPDAESTEVAIEIRHLLLKIIADANEVYSRLGAGNADAREYAANHAEKIKEIGNRHADILAAYRKIPRDLVTDDNYVNALKIEETIDRALRTYDGRNPPKDIVASETVASADSGNSATTPPLTTVPQPSDQIKSSELIESLGSEEAPIRHAARTEIANRGKAIVEDLVGKLKETRNAKNDNINYRTRLGIAIALQKMNQPMALTADQVAEITQLFQSNDSDTRLATLDFLINQEDPETIRLVYGNLVAKINEAFSAGEPKPATENEVMNAVTVIAGWATALSGNVRSGLSGETDEPMMNKAVLKQIEKWISDINKDENKKTHWSKVAARMNQMKSRAEKYQNAKKEAATKAEATISPSTLPLDIR